MTDLILLSILTIFTLLITDGRFHAPFTVPRMAFLSAGLLIFSGAWLVPKITLPSAIQPVLLYFAAALVSAFLGPRPHLAFKNWLYFFLLMLFGFVFLPLVPFKNVAWVMVLCGTAASVIAMLRLFPINLSRNLLEGRGKFAYSIVNDTNSMGAYLIPLVFLAYHFDWYLPASIMVITVYWTKCKGAIITLVAGAFIGFQLGALTENEVLLTITLLAVQAMLKRRHKPIEQWKATVTETMVSTGNRLQYIRVAFEQVKKTFWFGLGFNCLQVVNTIRQAEYNHKTKGEFLKGKAPWWQRAHNDYLQSLTDCGVVGTGFLVTVYLIALWQGQAIDRTILIASLIYGVFFHTLYVLPLSVTIWFILAHAVSGGPAFTFIMPFEFQAAFYFGLMAAYFYLFKQLLWSNDLWRFEKGQKQDLALGKFLVQKNPHDNLAHAYLSMGLMKQGAIAPAFFEAIHAFSRFSGELRMWEALYNLGLILVHAGCPGLARACFEAALQLWPDFKEAKDMIPRTYQMQMPTII